MSIRKNKSCPGTPEMRNVRNQLDGVLRDLVKQKNSSRIKSIAKLTFETNQPLNPSTNIDSTSTKLKSRKRKRHIESSDEDSHMSVNNTQVIMKFFDRKIDLAQISEEATLYSVARQWVRNTNREEHVGYSLQQQQQQQQQQNHHLQPPEQHQQQLQQPHVNSFNKPSNVGISLPLCKYDLDNDLDIRPLSDECDGYSNCSSDSSPMESTKLIFDSPSSSSKAVTESSAFSDRTLTDAVLSISTASQRGWSSYSRNHGESDTFKPAGSSILAATTPCAIKSEPDHAAYANVKQEEVIEESIVFDQQFMHDDHEVVETVTVKSEKLEQSPLYDCQYGLAGVEPNEYEHHSVNRTEQKAAPSSTKHLNRSKIKFSPFVMPNIIPNEEEALDINADEVDRPKISTLLESGLNRWRAVRHSWKRAFNVADRSNEEMLRPITEMYEITN